MFKYLTLSLVTLLLISDLAGQSNIIDNEFLVLTPYLSTREDVEALWGKGEIENDTIGYYKSKDRIIEITYLVDSENEKSEKIKSNWVVEEIYFVLEGSPSKRRLKNVIKDLTKFRSREYGDVEGQILYISLDKSIQITYFRDNKTVEDVKIMPTKGQRESFELGSRKTKSNLD